MQEKAFNVFGKTRAQSHLSKHSKPNTSHTRPRKLWFNKECFDSGKEFNSARNKYLRSKTVENKQLFLHKRTLYIHVKRKNKRKYMSEEGNRLNILAKSDPKSFWKHIKTHNKSKTVNPTNVSLDDS